MIPLTNRPLSCRFSKKWQSWQVFQWRDALDHTDANTPEESIQKLNERYDTQNHQTIQIYTKTGTKVAKSIHLKPEPDTVDGLAKQLTTAIASLYGPTGPLSANVMELNERLRKALRNRKPAIKA